LPVCHPNSWQLWLSLITTAVAVSCILWALDTSVRAMDHAADGGGGGGGGDGSHDCPMCRCEVHGALWNQSGAADAEAGREAAQKPVSAFKSEPGSAAGVGGAGTGAAEHVTRQRLLELLGRAHSDGAIEAMKNLGEKGRHVCVCVVAMA
jgi:hypothetical protein